MKKLLSVILVLSIFVACFNLGIAFVSASNTTSTDTNLNILDEKASTFEGGTTAWASFSAGSTSVVNNPLGEGKVVKYVHSGTNTWESTYLDMRPYIQAAMTEAGRLYISFDIYSATKGFKASVRVRTDSTGTYSACGESNLCRLYSSSDIINGAAEPSSSILVTAGQWHRVEFVMDVTAEDLAVTTDKWRLCFDGMSDYAGTGYVSGDAIYIDNVVACLSTHGYAEKTEITRDPYTKVGTVRWDAFTKSTEIPEGADISTYAPSSQVANVLSPSKYHYQAPFFANITESGKISFPEYTAETWEKEAMYAHQAGLDYFAYLWYENTSAMSQPRKYHLQSKNKNLIEMSGILETIRSTQTMFELFDAMKDSCWLRLDGRPVLFLYNVNSTRWTKEQVDAVRQMAYRAGVKESLYIIGMNTDYTDYDAKIYDRGMDAVSMYSYSASAQGEPYDNYTARLENLNYAMANAETTYEDHQIVPLFSLGRDGRPRIQTSVSWISGDPNAEIDTDKPYGNKYTLGADMATVKEHIANIYKITQDYAEVTKPNLVFSYAWNEHDEGGWLCPTLNCDEDGNLITDDPINTERVDTLRAALDELREASYISKPTADPNATKTVYNGDAESGIQNWGNIHGGSLGYIQPGANGTNNAIRFIPSADTNINNSIAFNIAPAIINDSDYNLSGCGAGYYKISFWAKAKSIPTGANGKFTVGIDSKNHISSSVVSQYTYYSTYNTYFSGADGVSSGITMTEEWQQFTVTIKVEDGWLKMMKQLRESEHEKAAQTYNIVLRLDGSGIGMAFGSAGASYEYYIDELSITYSQTSSGTYAESYPTPTLEAAMPTATPAPTPIPQGAILKYLEYEIGEENVVITGSSMDIHGDVTIPNTIASLPVTEIKDGAFKYRAQLTSVTLPATVKTIGDFAFEKCINLKTVNMSESVTYIGEHAFCGADNLTGDIKISKAVTEIKPYTFYGCSSLESVKYFSSETWFDDNVTISEGNDYLTDVVTFKANSIEGATLNIGSSLNIDYYAYFEADPAEVSMLFTNENGVKRTVVGEYDSKYDLYKFTYSAINPQCMTDTIKAELILNDGTVLDVKEEYSVKAYCDSLATKTAAEVGSEVKNAHILRRLLADTLIYGAEAQRKQNYKLDDMADASSWIAGYKTTFTSPTGVKNIIGNADAENRVKSVSLNMSTHNKIYFRLVLTDETVKIILNDVEVSRDELQKQEDGTYILYTEGLKATEFDKVYTLKLIQDETVITQVDYNINAYIQAKYSSSSVGGIVQALNNYGVSAVNYVKMINGEYDGGYDLDEEDDLLSGTTGGSEEVVTYSNLIPEISSNFDSATSVSDTAWVKGAGGNSIVDFDLADDGKGGKCIYYTRTNTTDNFTTIAIDISRYITHEGEYTISFRYKVTGDTSGDNPFSGVVRTSGATSFATSGSGNTTYGGLGSAEPVESGVWANHTATLVVKSTDIGVGGKWLLGLHVLNAAITEVYLDDVTIIEVDYDSMAQAVETAETWVANEVVFISDKWYEDPYHEVTMDLILTNGHVEYTIPCFWDGGKVWRARFVCPTAGTWTYTTTCSDNQDTVNTGLNGQEGKFVCTTYAGDLDIYKHGFITAKYNNATRQKYFTYADGTPFFYLGDTHWNFDRESVDVVKTVVNKRVQQGFTVFQSEAGSNSSIFQNGFTASDLIQLNNLDTKFKYIAQNGLVHAHSQFFFPEQMDNFINYYGQLYGNDAVLLTDASGNTLYSSLNNEQSEIYLYGIDTSKYLATETAAVRKIYIEGTSTKYSTTYSDIKLYDYTDEVKAELKHMARYWIARYSAYPVMWTLGQEVDDDYMFSTSSYPTLKTDETEKTTIGFNHPMWGNANNPYKLVAKYMSDLDPYNSPLTAHQETSSRVRVEASAFNNIFNSAGQEVHTWYAAQFKTKFNFADNTDDANLTTVYERTKEFWNSNKVTVNYEGYYDMLQTETFGARAQGWIAYLSGMFGHGWGSQGTWQYLGTYLDNTEVVNDGVDYMYLSERQEENDWTKALERTSAYQMGYMRDFFSYAVGDWHTLVPRFDDTNYFTRDSGAYAFVASNSDNSKVVIYFCNFSDTTVAETTNSSYGTATGTVKGLEKSTTYYYMWFNPITGKTVSNGKFTTTSSGTWHAGAKQTCDMVLYIYK